MLSWYFWSVFASRVIDEFEAPDGSNAFFEACFFERFEATEASLLRTFARFFAPDLVAASSKGYHVRWVGRDGAVQHFDDPNGEGLVFPAMLPRWHRAWAWACGARCRDDRLFTCERLFDLLGFAMPTAVEERTPAALRAAIRAHELPYTPPPFHKFHKLLMARLKATTGGTDWSACPGCPPQVALPASNREIFCPSWTPPASWDWYRIEGGIKARILEVVRGSAPRFRRLKPMDRIEQMAYNATNQKHPLGNPVMGHVCMLALLFGPTVQSATVDKRGSTTTLAWKIMGRDGLRPIEEEELLIVFRSVVEYVTEYLPDSDFMRSHGGPRKFDRPVDARALRRMLHVGKWFHRGPNVLREHFVDAPWPSPTTTVRGFLESTHARRKRAAAPASPARRKRERADRTPHAH